MLVSMLSSEKVFVIKKTDILPCLRIGQPLQSLRVFARSPPDQSKFTPFCSFFSVQLISDGASEGQAAISAGRQRR